MMVLLLFFCSGATALVYEVLWSKYLSLLLGSTVQAQTVVLAVFMGGLALGNRLFGARADLLRHPLAIYGYLELIIGVYGFLFPRLYNFGDTVYIAIGTPLFGSSILLLFLKIFLSAALLLIPTVLMGGTLPLLAGWIQRQHRWESGARVGIFYAINSLGAVAGAGLGGLLMVPTIGMVSSLELTALVNCIVGLAAIIISKREAFEPRPPVPQKAATLPSSNLLPVTGFIAWPAALVAITGGTSMGLEVLAARCLALIVGGSLQAFALVLMAFILGIGIGSVIISSNNFARKYPFRTLIVLLISAGTVVSISVVLIEQWIVLYSHARMGLAPNEWGYAWHQFLVGGIALLFLGIPAALLGAVVPLTIRAVSTDESLLARRVGELLTWNTIGAVVGVLLTGFFLMPVFGLRAALSILSIGLIILAGFLAFSRQDKQGMVAAAALSIVVLAAVLATGEGWRAVLGSGVFRMRNQVVSQETIQKIKSRIDLLFYKDAPDATVSVERSKDDPNSQVILRINGKTDASSFGDLSTQYLLAHLPMMMKPDAKDVFVLGFGSGITAGAFLGHPIEHLVIAENCKPVLEAGHFFEQWNRGVLTNSRTEVRTEDARAVLKLRPRNYDIIISEPSNPWVAGIGSVFSKEFYELAASRLNEGGIMAQWFHIYEMHDGIVFLVLRTFAEVFPHMEIWDTQDGDIVLLGSKTPWESSPSVYQKVFQRPVPKSDLSRIGLTSGVAMWSRQVASQKTGFAVPGDGPIQTDEFPILEYSAPRAFFLGQNAARLFDYDDRTIQYPLTSGGKLQVLRALPDSSLLPPFAYFASCNPTVNLYIHARSTKNTNVVDSFGPIAFASPSQYKEEFIVPPGAIPEHASLIELEQWFLTRPDKWELFVDETEKVLQSLLARDLVGKINFSAPHFAAIAARHAMGHNDYERALRILRLGFLFSLQDEQLSFLSRALDRIIPPEMLQSLRQSDPLKNSSSISQ